MDTDAMCDVIFGFEMKQERQEIDFFHLSKHLVMFERYRHFA